jgi:hypothetical protein
MSIYVKSGGVWQLPRWIYVKSGGTWVLPRNIYVNSGGVWKKEYSVITLVGTNLNVNCAALFGTDALTAVLINNGIIGSAGTGSPGLDATGMNGNSTLYVINNGYIVGMGGTGGPGGGGGGSNGGNGGDAISMHCSLLLDNFGVIGGGGGGGAGGPTWPGHFGVSGAGGGGGAGQNVGIGGGGTELQNNGGNGTLTSGGGGGGGHCAAANGGNLGLGGGNSGSCDAQPGATGGGAGAAIRLNGFSITYRTAGAIYGTVS